MKGVTKSFHETHYVARVMNDEVGVTGTGHDIKDEFNIENVKVMVTPADHSWQNDRLNKYDRVFKFEDYCGFY